MMLYRDEVITLPSGTEISVEAALSDLDRIRLELLNETENDDYPVDFSAEAADLKDISDLLVLLARAHPFQAEHMMLKAGDHLVVERKTGYSTYGTFVGENENGLFIMGTVGNRIGDLIFIRWENVDQVRVSK